MDANLRERTFPLFFSHVFSYSGLTIVLMRVPSSDDTNFKLVIQVHYRLTTR